MSDVVRSVALITLKLELESDADTGIQIKLISESDEDAERRGMTPRSAVPKSRGPFHSGCPECNNLLPLLLLFYFQRQNQRFHKSLRSYYIIKSMF